jgi:hypothetical protein
MMKVIPDQISTFLLQFHLKNNLSRILFGHKICMSRCFPQITITATYINVKFVVMQLPSYSSCVHFV